MNQAVPVENSVSVERIGPTAIVRLNRGKNKNALSQAVILELTRVAAAFHEERSITTVILTGTRTEFSAGVDLKDPARWEIDPADIEGIRMASARGAAMCNAWENIPQLTIAAVEGINVGGGIALTLCCDWRVQSEASVMLLPEAQIGLPLSWQTVPRLVNIVGASKAKQLILLGEKLTSRDALELGLIDFIVPAGTAIDKALALADKVNKNSRLVTTLTKHNVNTYANALNHLASHMDIDQSVLCGLSESAVRTREEFGA
jgi:enoyl-CoA hydratase/carnithine racemase